MDAASASPLPTTARELKAVIEAEREASPFLLYRDEKGGQRLLRLDGESRRVSIGRRSSNDVVLFWDNQVSRAHVEFECIGGEWAVVDDGLSRNGTFVNGNRVSARQRLEDGDTVRIGNTLVVFRAPTTASTVATHAGGDQLSAERLSPAQRKVLVSLCRPYKEAVGLTTPATNQQIAEELYLSIDAVKTHLRSLFTKLGVGDLPQNQKRVRLVERAFQLGMVSEREL